MNIASLNNPLYLNNMVAANDAKTSNGSAPIGGSSFAQMVNQKIEEANSLQKEADQLTESFLVGEPVEIHQMLIAMEKADLALRETMEIRNKLLEAYKEIEKMQI